MTRLDRDPAVLELARELGLSTRGRVLERIRDHALSYVEDCRASLPRIASLEQLRSLLCDRLSICIRIIHEDADLNSVAEEFSFSEVERRNLIREFDHEQVEGWLVRNPRVEPGLRRWIAIVDGRGPRAVRAYFTAWHEIAHAIVTPHQLKLGIRRSIPVDKSKDPVESVVDSVTGDLAFYAPLISPALRQEISTRGGRLSVDAIEAMRLKVAPSASFQSAAIAATRLSEHPVLFVRLKRQYKRSEIKALQSNQSELPLAGAAPRILPKVRLAMAMPAAEAGSELAIFSPMRVPPGSVLMRAWENPRDVCLQADEDQAWWETSKAGNLPPQPIHVEALRRGSFVYGLIAPA